MSVHEELNNCMIRHIEAEVWDRYLLRVSHTRPISRHYSVEAARQKCSEMNAENHKIYGCSPYIVLRLVAGAFVPDHDALD